MVLAEINKIHQKLFQVEKASKIPLEIYVIIVNAPSGTIF